MGFLGVDVKKTSTSYRTTNLSNALNQATSYSTGLENVGNLSIAVPKDGGVAVSEQGLVVAIGAGVLLLAGVILLSRRRE